MLNKRRERNAEGMAEGSQFHEIKPPFTALAFADERLRLADTCGEFNLRQAAPPAGRPQLAQKHCVLPRRDALIHGPTRSFTIRVEKGIVQDRLFAVI